MMCSYHCGLLPLSSDKENTTEGFSKIQDQRYSLRYSLGTRSSTASTTFLPARGMSRVVTASTPSFRSWRIYIILIRKHNLEVVSARDQFFPESVGEWISKNLDFSGRETGIGWDCNWRVGVLEKVLRKRKHHTFGLRNFW